MKFRIANNWAFNLKHPRMVNIELFSITYSTLGHDTGLSFWITILGISLIWEK